MTIVTAFSSAEQSAAAVVTSTWTGVVGNWGVSTNWINNPAMGGFPNNGNDGVATYDAVVGGGTATLDQSIVIQRFTLTGGTVGGTFNLTANEPITWTSGTMNGAATTIANGNVSIGGVVTLNTRTLRVANSATQSNGWVAGSNAAVITNVAGSTFNILDDSSLRHTSGSLSMFQNAGTLLKSGAGNNAGGFGAGVSTIQWGVTNSGTIQVNAGTMTMAAAGSSSGVITVAPPARIRFNSSYNFTGAVRAPGMVHFAGGTANIRGPYTAGSTMIDGAVADFSSTAPTTVGLDLFSGVLAGQSNFTVNGMTTWMAGSMEDTGTTTANGFVAIDGFVTIDERKLRLASSATLTNGSMFGSTGAVIINQAGSTYDIQDDSSLLDFGGDLPMVQNAGILTKSGGGNNISGFGPGVSVIQWGVTNTGTVSAQNGTLRFTGGYTQTAGRTALSGGTIGSTTPLRILGGELIGNGTIIGSVTNNGTLSPGFSAGSITVTNGTLTLFGGSIFKAELGGYTQGTQHDFVRVRSNATLGGSLQINFINGFNNTITNGASFTLLTADTPLAGAFANVASGGSLVSADGFRVFTVTYAGSTHLRINNLGPVTDTDGDGMPDWWEDLYGLNKNNPADANQDADGDGLTNLQEFLAGTRPNDAGSALAITSVVREGNDIRITWSTAGGRTNQLQVTSGAAGGDFATNNFTNIGPQIIIPGGGDAVTNRVDAGGATNSPARYYRVRLVP